MFEDDFDWSWHIDDDVVIGVALVAPHLVLRLATAANALPRHEFHDIALFHVTNPLGPKIIPTSFSGWDLCGSVYQYLPMRVYAVRDSSIAGWDTVNAAVEYARSPKRWRV